MLMAPGLLLLVLPLGPAERFTRWQERNFFSSVAEVLHPSECEFVGLRRRGTWQPQALLLKLSATPVRFGAAKWTTVASKVSAPTSNRRTLPYPRLQRKHFKLCIGGRAATSLSHWAGHAASASSNGLGRSDLRHPSPGGARQPRHARSKARGSRSSQTPGQLFLQA